MATSRKNKVIIAGGSGFIGANLAEKLAISGYEVVILTRSPGLPQENSFIRYVGWDAKTPGDWVDELEGALAIVNLAGESIAGENLASILFSRWTLSKKQAIRQSRISTGNVLAEAVLKAKKKPQVFIQASGIGYYGTSSNSALDEDSFPGTDFLATVSMEWEGSSIEVTSSGVRHAVIRSGVVLDTEGGILPLLALPIKLFLGGRLGSGSQPFPWIHIQDEIRAIQFLIENKNCRGAFNLAAPGSISNAGFGKKLAQVLRRPFYLPIPAFLLNILLGEKSILVLEGQQAIPNKLLKHGFIFDYPDAATAIQELFTEESPSR